MSLYFSIIIFLLLCLSMFAYLLVAKKFNILDIPNNRSSHNKPIIRGGGIIFPISIFLYSMLFEISYPYFLLSLFLISSISFVDDVYTISSKWRFIIQLISATLLIIELFQPFSAYYLILIPLFVGIFNAYNFMDGINGITASYSFVNLLSLLVINHFVGFIENDLLIVILMSLIIFGFLNFRKKAVCFAGDIGSVSIALIVLFLIMKLIVFTKSPVFILLLSVYGIDTGLTLFSRILNKENVLTAHREHLYQKLVDFAKLSHLKVSFLYSLVQLLINFVLVFFITISEFKYSFSLLIITILYFSYTFVKNNVVEK